MLELKSWLNSWRAIPILRHYPLWHQSKILLDGNAVLQPLHKSTGITSIREVKIQTIGLWFDIGSLAMHLCLDDLLLKEIEGTLMLHLLNDLSITNKHTFWRSWTTALQECSIDSIIQSSHVLASTIKHTMKDCWRTTPNASFWTVIFTLIRREWGSVHTNSASTNFTCFKPMDYMIFDIAKPLIFFKQKASNSLLSGGASVHGGLKNLYGLFFSYEVHTFRNLYTGKRQSVSEFHPWYQPLNGCNWYTCWLCSAGSESSKRNTR